MENDLTPENVAAALAEDRQEAPPAPEPGPGTEQPAAPNPAPPAQSSAAEIAAAVAAALAGMQQPREVAPAVAPRKTVRQAIAAMTPEQKANLEVRYAQDPTAVMIELADMMAAERMEQFASAAAPTIDTTNDLFVEHFLSQKSASDGLFGQIAPKFRAELSQADRRAIMQLPADERQRQLDMRWQAAGYGVYRAAAAAPRPAPTTLTGARGGSPAPGKAAPAGRNPFADDPNLAALAATLMANGSIEQADIDDARTNYHESLF